MTRLTVLEENTDWAGGEYRVHMHFPEDYPSKSPKCMFVPPLFHPSVFPSDTISLRMFYDDEAWTPSTTIKQMLQGIYDFLDHPDPINPAQSEAYRVFLNDREEYDRRVRMEAKKNPPATA